MRPSLPFTPPNPSSVPRGWERADGMNCRASSKAALRKWQGLGVLGASSEAAGPPWPAWVQDTSGTCCRKQPKVPDPLHPI